MKFALIDKKKTSAKPKLVGECPFCGGRMKANCGEFKIWHWAHLSKKECDPWWESETEWHRMWKNYFPIECQEIIHTNEQTGEKHIADIKTQNNMVIEFQNSPISFEEVASRENFFKNMFWVINGNRKGTMEKANFNVSIGTGYELKSKEPLIIKFHWAGRSRLFERWSTSRVPVFFDFDTEELLWLKSYDAKSKKVTVRITGKNELIEKNGGIYTSNPKA